MIYAEYNMRHNSFDIYTSAGYILIIDCEKAEAGIKTTLSSQHTLDVLALDTPLEYAKLYLDGTMQDWIDSEDSLEVW